jgi:hypothetical protein
MVSDRPPEDPDLLSPELVLVSDEETMRRAREQLPEHPWLAVRNGAVADAPLPPRLVFEEAAQTPEAPAAPRPRRRGRLGAAVVLVLALVVAGFLTETRWRDAGATTAEDVPSAASTPGTSTAPAPTRTAGASQTEPALTLAPPTATAPAPQTTRPATTPASQPTTAPRPTTTRAQRQTTASPPPRPSGFVPARTWTWAPAKGAQTYEVTFYLDGRVVLRERVKGSRLVMPGSFRFKAGRYRWTVRAIPAASPTARIVDSSFVLTPATAAAANSSGG